MGGLLKIYQPQLRVAIFEAERFPRPHVGESLLPVTCEVLDELAVWDKVEAAEFPVKVGGTYRWGSTDDLWQLNFIPSGAAPGRLRPARYEGIRTATAFQVDRERYDKILLDHASELGCLVAEGTRIRTVQRSGDRAEGLVTESGEVVTAGWYVDASASALFRSAFEVGVQEPSLLRNIAIWDYWQDAEWAERIADEGTRIQVMSLGWGWVWFITISPTRTSVGLVTSAERFKRSGKSTEALYLEAIEEEPRIKNLLRNAVRESALSATKDWSFIADRLSGENWFLAGDSCGFADPILSAGLTLAQMGGRRVAFSILEIDRGEHPSETIRGFYDSVQSQNIKRHIRFADYWYSANGRFTDLTEYCAEIARNAGISLNAEEAFRWLATGGFTSEVTGLPVSATFRIGSMKGQIQRFSGAEVGWKIATYNVFKRNAEGAAPGSFPFYLNGRVYGVPCLFRDGLQLPLHLAFKFVWNALGKESEITLLLERFMHEARLEGPGLADRRMGAYCLEALEAMVLDGWVTGQYDPILPNIDPAKLTGLRALTGR